MNATRTWIDGVVGDPVAQLVAALVEQGVTPDLLGPADQPGAEDQVWFVSQQAFFEAASRLKNVPCTINVILRRARADTSEAARATELALLAILAEQFPAGRLQFYALSAVALAEATQAGFTDCALLGETTEPSEKRRLAELDASARRLRLYGASGESFVGLEDVNVARIARDYRIIPREPAEADWTDIADLARRMPVSRATREYLFITPNGVGLGHLTRQLAVAQELVAKALPDETPEITFWCFSRAASIIQRAGFKVMLRHTAEHLGADVVPWLAWETAAFAQFLRLRRPAAIIADGSRVEPFIVDALKQPGCHHSRLVWIRRGMWRSDADDRGLADIRFCDRVLVPGDLAAEADMGATARTNPNPTGLSLEVVTPPVVMKPAIGTQTRRAARKRFRLGMGRFCLVSLGGDSFARTSIMHHKLAEAANRNGVRLVWAQSPLAAMPPGQDRDERRISLYPVSPYFAAFDGIVSAAGYNSFHELLHFTDRPVLFVPTTNERADDQAARARFAAAQGWASVLEHETGEAEDEKIDVFFRSLRLGSRTARPAFNSDGASAMAAEIAALTLGRKVT